MKCQATEPITLKIKNELLTISVGEVLNLSKDQAERLRDKITIVDSVPHLASTWKPGNPFVCDCGDATGWRNGMRPCCPVCEFNRNNTDAKRARLLAHADDLEQAARMTKNPEKKAARLAVVAAIRAETRVVSH
jgi:hypothetical protein